jgi:hypothetical protein
LTCDWRFRPRSNKGNQEDEYSNVPENRAMLPSTVISTVNPPLTRAGQIMDSNSMLPVCSNSLAPLSGICVAISAADFQRLSHLAEKSPSPIGVLVPTGVRPLKLSASSNCPWTPSPILIQSETKVTAPAPGLGEPVIETLPLIIDLPVTESASAPTPNVYLLCESVVLLDISNLVFNESSCGLLNSRTTPAHTKYH